MDNQVVPSCDAWLCQSIRVYVGRVRKEGDGSMLLAYWIGSFEHADEQAAGDYEGVVLPFSLVFFCVSTTMGV